MIMIAKLFRNRTPQAALVLGVLLTLFACFAPSPVRAATTEAELKKVFNCDPEVDGSLGQSFREGNKKDTMRRAAVIQDTYRQMNYKSSSGCIIKIMGYLDVIQKVLSGALSLIATAVLGLVTWLIGYVCKYVVTTINNLLASICLPIPNLSLSMSLPSLQSKSCDGISLLNVISVKGSSLGGGGSLPSLSLDSAVRRMMRK
jgi:hypothetical protein